MQKPALAAANPYLPWPWLDRRGQVSALHAVAFALLLLPALWVLGLALAGSLGPEPLKAAMKEIGRWTIRLLLLTLALTPVARLAVAPRLVTIRRMLGLGTMAYGLMHLLLFLWHEEWLVYHAIKEIVTRFYLTIGFVALLGLAVLAWTSTDAWMKRLGGLWRRLHSLVWPIALLALWHFFLQSKSLVFEAVVSAGLLGWLVAWRLLPPAARFRPVTLSLIALGAASVAAVSEYAFYALATNLPALRILAANFDPSLAPRPAHWVFFGLVAMPILIVLLRRPPTR